MLRSTGDDIRDADPTDVEADRIQDRCDDVAKIARNALVGEAEHSGICDVECGVEYDEHTDRFRLVGTLRFVGDWDDEALDCLTFAAIDLRSASERLYMRGQRPL